ncbi:hypothetical protein PFISCL1PPCAC_10748, partial [Pristionchus fissidentatus]
GKRNEFRIDRLRALDGHAMNGNNQEEEGEALVPQKQSRVSNGGYKKSTVDASGRRAAERKRPLLDALSTQLTSVCHNLHAQWSELWRDLSNKEQMRFKWPLHTPLEVH